MALGVRIVDAKKSKYYDAALGHLRRARDLLVDAGEGGAWSELVDEIRAKHCRKWGFMGGFEELVEGREELPEPSFLERARSRWAEGARGQAR